MMKKNTLLYVVFFFCSYGAVISQAYAGKKKIKDPEFIKTKNWKLNNFNSFSDFDLYGVAVFFNPNKVKAKLQDINLAVFLEDKKLGEVVQIDRRTKIPKKSTFDVPFSLKARPQKGLGTLLSSALKFISNEDLDIHIKGYIKLKVFGLPIKIPVDDKQMIGLDLILQQEKPE